MKKQKHFNIIQIHINRFKMNLLNDQKLYIQKQNVQFQT